MKDYPLILNHINFISGIALEVSICLKLTRQLFSRRENHGLFRASRILPFSIDPSVMNIYLSCCESASKSDTYEQLRGLFVMRTKILFR